MNRIIVVASILAAFGSGAAHLQTTTIERYTIDAGGGQSSSKAGEFELTGTIGQPDASLAPLTGTSAEGTNLELTGGFWFRLAAGDCNGDGSVNLFDFGSFSACVTGPTPGALEGACRCFDFDNDDDVDVPDFGAFQRSFGH